MPISKKNTLVSVKEMIPFNTLIEQERSLKMDKLLSLKKENPLKKPEVIFSEKDLYICGDNTYQQSILGICKSVPLVIEQIKAERKSDIGTEYLNKVLQETKLRWENWKQFNENYQSMFRKSKKMVQAFPSVISYLMAKKQILHSHIKNMYNRYYEKAVNYKTNSLCIRSNIEYDLNIEEFRHYQMLYCLYLAGEENPQILADIRNCYGTYFFNEKEYAEFLYKNAPEDCNINQFLSSIVNVYVESLQSGVYIEQALELVLILNEYFSYYKGTEERDYVETLCHAFLMMFYRDPHILPQKIVCNLSKTIEKRLDYKQNSQSTMKYLSAIESVMVSVAKEQSMFPSSQILNKGIKYFINTKKSEKDQLLNCFLTRYCIREFLSKKISVDEFIETVIAETTAVCENVIISEEKNKSAKSAKLIKEVWANFSIYVANYIDFKDRLPYDMGIEILPEVEVEKNMDRSQEKLLMEIEALKKENAQLKSMDFNTKALKSTLSEQKKEIENLKQLLREEEKNRKELIGLRNYVYETSMESNQNQINTEPEAITIEEMADFLNKNVKGVFVGGHINFHNKISKYLPDWKKVSIEKAVDANTLKNTDILVMYTDHIDHSSYLTTMANVRSSDCKLLYIHNVNLECVVKKIYEFMEG